MLILVRPVHASLECFVDPKGDAKTNSFIASQLAQQVATEECISFACRDITGQVVSRNVWACPNWLVDEELRPIAKPRILVSTSMSAKPVPASRRLSAVIGVSGKSRHDLLSAPFCLRRPSLHRLGRFFLARAFPDILSGTDCHEENSCQD